MDLRTAQLDFGVEEVTVLGAAVHVGSDVHRHRLLATRVQPRLVHRLLVQAREVGIAIVFTRIAHPKVVDVVDLDEVHAFA